MKVGQIYYNKSAPSLRFMVLKEYGDGWSICEVFTPGGWGFWHDWGQKWTHGEMEERLPDWGLLTEPMELDNMFKTFPRQVIE